MNKLNFKSHITENFIEHAEKDYPYEACGFLVGDRNNLYAECSEYIPIPNQVIENRERRFIIDPLEYMKVEEEVEKKDKSIIGIFHSHPDHPDEPSDFDRDHAFPGLSYVIISVKKGRNAGYRSWQLRDNRSQFDEEKIIINGGI